MHFLNSLAFLLITILVISFLCNIYHNILISSIFQVSKLPSVASLTNLSSSILSEIHIVKRNVSRGMFWIFSGVKNNLQ